MESVLRGIVSKCTTVYDMAQASTKVENDAWRERLSGTTAYLFAVSLER